MESKSDVGSNKRLLKLPRITKYVAMPTSHRLVLIP